MPISFLASMLKLQEKVSIAVNLLFYDLNKVYKYKNDIYLNNSSSTICILSYKFHIMPSLKPAFATLNVTNNSNEQFSGGALAL